MRFFKYVYSVFEGILAGFCMLCMWIACPFHPLFHNAITQWGSTPEERTMELPGEELLTPDHPKVARVTFVITINRPPADIWPWLVQIGMSKGAVYSYDCWENILCSCTCNADEIVPEWQTPSVGDTVYLCHPKCAPGCAKETIKICEKERHFVLGLFEEDASGHFQGIWGFHLIPIDANTTRFVARITGGAIIKNQFLQCLWFFIEHIFMEPVHFMMQRKMLLGIKYRAETKGGPHDRLSCEG